MVGAEEVVVDRAVPAAEVAVEEAAVVAAAAIVVFTKDTALREVVRRLNEDEVVVGLVAVGLAMREEAHHPAEEQ